MGALKGYLPPEEPHTLPYEYLEDQEAHSTRQMVLPGPEAVILTARQDAHDILEGVLGLQEIPEDVAEEALEAYQGDGDPGEVIDEWQAEDSQEEPEQTAEIPGDLEALEYGDLQDLAKEHDIPANQSTQDLIEALEEVASE